MTQPLARAVTDTLTYLETTSQEAVPPPEALRRLADVQIRHPGISMQLLWDVEAYDGAVHYDVLIRPPTGVTVSMSLCRGDSLPWPLRGVRRWSDADLLQVNGRLLTMREAVDLLDVVWNEAPIMERMINVCLIRDELAQRPIELSDAELQHGMDGWRRAHLLYTVEDTERWMKEHGMSHERLEQLVTDSLTLIKLRERVAAGRVEEYYKAHRDDLVSVRVVRVACGDEETARHVHEAVVAGKLTFMQAAQQQYMAGHDQKTSFLTLRRRDVAGDALALFRAVPGDIVGPLLLDETPVVARVLSVTQPSHAECEITIQQLLMEEWLAERRRSASIQWFWGTAARTVPGGLP